MTEPTYDDSEDWIDPIFDAVVSVFQASGYFDVVNGHEPKRKPRHGLQAAVWFQKMVAVGAISGLSASSGVLLFSARLYSNMTKEPQDSIDPRLMRAASNLMRRFHDDFDFDLDPVVRNVDLLGTTGFQLDCNAAYLEQSGGWYRVYDLVIPVIVNDVWPQNA